MNICFQKYYGEIDDIICYEEDEYESFDKNVQTFVVYKLPKNDFDFSQQEELNRKYRKMYIEEREKDIICKEEEKPDMQKDTQTFVLYKINDKSYDFSKNKELIQECRKTFFEIKKFVQNYSLQNEINNDLKFFYSLFENIF